MANLLKLLILIFETIKEWLSSKSSKKVKKQEQIEETESKLEKAISSGTIADLQKTAIELKKANK